MVDRLRLVSMMFVVMQLLYLAAPVVSADDPLPNDPLPEATPHLTGSDTVVLDSVVTVESLTESEILVNTETPSGDETAVVAATETPVATESPSGDETPVLTESPSERTTITGDAALTETVMQPANQALQVAPPTITINGSTGPLQITAGESVLPEFPEAAMWAMFENAMCDGSPIFPWSNEAEGHTSVSSAGTYSFQARWGTDDSTRGNCLIVTWFILPPVLTVNHLTGPWILKAGEYGTPRISEGAVLGIFNNESCSFQSGGWQTHPQPITSTLPHNNTSYSIWLQAAWSDDLSNRSECVEARWVDPPSISINGSQGPLVIVGTGYEIFPSVYANAQFGTHLAIACGQPTNEWFNPGQGLVYTEPTVVWLRARLNYAHHIQGSCIVVQVVDPPTVTISGSSDNQTYVVGTSILASPPDDAELALFESADCSGDPLIGWSATNQNIVRSDPGTYSVQARLPGNDATRGNCVSVTFEPVSIPTLNATVCGEDNDTLTLPAAQTGITFTDSGWEHNSRTIEFFPTDDYVFPEDTQTKFTFTDSGPCAIERLLPPVHTELCGIPRNDLVEVPTAPVGVTITNSGAWSDQSSWSVSYSIDDPDYKLPDGVLASYVFTDKNEPCVVDPTGRQLTLVLLLPDAGSIEGTAYQVYAAVASQFHSALYFTGVVGPNNVIVIEDIIPGEYRFVMSPDGYQPIDIVLNVTENSNQIELALQVVDVPSQTATPTSSATPSPTNTPSATSTAGPDSTPNHPSAVQSSQSVTGLPDTGAGSNAGILGQSLVGTSILMLMALVVRRTYSRGGSSP